MKIRTSTVFGFVLVGIGLAVPVVSEEASDPTALSLKDVVQIAIRRSPRVEAAAYGVDAAREARDVARRQSLPKASLEASYEAFPFRNKLITPRHMDVPEFPLSGAEMLEFNRNQFAERVFNFGVVWSLPVFTGGRISSEVEFTSLATEAAEFTLHTTRNDLVLALARSYYGILRVRRAVRAMEVSVANLEESARIVKLSLDAGKAAPVDMLRIETRLANVRQNLIQARNAETISEATLKMLMGLETTESPVVISETLGYTPARYDLAASTERALSRRPEFLRQTGLVQMQQARVSIARAAYLPNLTLHGGYRGVLSDRNDDPIGDGMVTVTLTQALFDEPARNRISRQQVRLRQAQADLEQMRLSVTLEVETAYLNLVDSQERIQAAEAALQAAEESLRIEQIKLEEGKGIVNDVLDAQADQLLSELNHIRALADYKIAVVAMQRAVGDVEYAREEDARE